MAENSAIEWTDTTWNPVTGCTKVSLGCDNCYAARFSERFRGVPGLLRERLRFNLAAGTALAAARMEEASDDFREFHERPLPQGSSKGPYRQGIRYHGEGR